MNRITLSIVSLLIISPFHSALGEAQKISYTEREEAFANPLKGWVVWGEDYFEPPQPASLFFSYRSWRKLEPVEGQYDFESWETEVWQPWIERGMKAIFRVYLDYPGRSIGVPQWLLDAGLETTEYDEYGGGWSPDYENPLLLEKVKKLIAALGERYDDDPRVAFLDVGILGHWGEWHTYPREELFASQRVQREVMEAFLDAFPHKKMMLRYPTLWTAQRPFGYRDDCFMSETEGPEDWYFFSRIRSAKAENVWQTQPYGGEFCGGDEGATTDTIEQPEECLRLIQEGHFSHLGPAGGDIRVKNAEHQKNLDRMLRLMGYRFVLRNASIPAEMESGGTANLQLVVSNTGVAPFYYSWPLEVVWFDGEEIEKRIETSEVDITQWLPGEHEYNLSIQAPDVSGMETFRIGLRIPDPSSQGPAVQFANNGVELNGAFILGSIQVNSVTACETWLDH